VSTDLPTAWQAFVVRHRDPLNLRVHFASMCVYLVGCTGFFYILATEYRWAWSWFLLWCSSGPIGAAGHWYTEDGKVSVKEATHDPLVPLFVFRMFWLIAQGRYQAEIDDALVATGLDAR
jgi:hypothetical protein